MRRSFSTLHCLSLRSHSCRNQSYLQKRCLSLHSRSYHGDDRKEYDVIVVGGGHAGTEAACASARLGAQTLLVTHKFETVGSMSCNPSFGGIGKGHLMKEIDALDGVCSRICDKSGLQYKVLNRRKGPAVWGHRAQIDRDLYKANIQQEILNTQNLYILTSTVEDLLLRETASPDSDLTIQDCYGVILGDGTRIYGRSIVLTAGTFLRGIINIGLSVREAGRLGDQPAVGLARSLQDAGFIMGRLKTGTPPRLDGRTIDYSKTKPMIGDDPPVPFSFLNEHVWIKAEDQLLCHLTETNAEVEKIVLDTLHVNKHVKEEITGPRFCPSLESKVLRFKGRRHIVWLEPEGFNSSIVYPNGISCTMPEDDQVRLVRKIPGLEYTEILQPGYGVEYDYMDPRQLKPSLETLRIQNLYFAGQINGTTGYEEAGAQGLMAGINAALKSQKKPAFLLDRTESYIGVLIDDLITQGTNEPYRMFTSRAEFRLSLRPDNADVRLTEKGYRSGFVSQHRHQRCIRMKSSVEETIDKLKSMKQSKIVWDRVLNLPDSRNPKVYSAFDILCIQTMTIDKLAHVIPDILKDICDDTAISSKIETAVKYSGELEAQKQDIKEVKKDENLYLPETLDYSSLQLSQDATEKLCMARPATIGAASRIPGMTPAALVILLRHVKKLDAAKRPYASFHIVKPNPS